MTREEIVRLGNEAIAKAKKDPEFKKKLLSDGNKAVKELTGKELPIKLTVHDTDEKHLVFILPEVLSGELDESALSGVSGGVDGWRVVAYGVFPDTLVYRKGENNIISNKNNLNNINFGDGNIYID